MSRAPDPWGFKPVDEDGSMAHNVVSMKGLMAEKAFFRDDGAMHASHGTLVEYVKTVQRQGREFGRAQWYGFCEGYFRGTDKPYIRDPWSVEPHELRRFLWELERSGCWEAAQVSGSVPEAPSSPANSYGSKGSDKGAKGSWGSKGQGKQKGDKGDALPGDWYCTMCGKHNYRKNKGCIRCRMGTRPPQSLRVQ